MAGADSAVILGVVVFGIFAVAFVLGLVTFHRKSPHNKDTNKSSPEKFAQPQPENGFTIHNYINTGISLFYYPPTGKNEITLYDYIPPDTNVVIPWKDVKLEVGGKIRVMEKTSREATPKPLYNDYVILAPDDSELHIGMVSTRKQNYASSNIYGGVYEIKQLYIHNRTNRPLTLNSSIRIKPGSFVIYDGFNLGGGVAVGERFYNDEGLFDDFEIQQPITDLYYGIVSNHPFPLYQGERYWGEKW